MAVQDYNGGGDVVLNSFYNTLNQSWNRNQARILKEQSDQAELIAKQQKELGDIVKKVNTTGIQSQDVGDMTAKLDKIYDTYYKANKATSRDERLRLRMELERDINDMGQFVYNSKQRGAEQLKRAEWIGDPNNAGLVSASALNKYKQFADLPTSKLPEGAFEISNYAEPDTSYLNKTVESLAKSLLDASNSSIKYGGRKQIGNQMATEQFKERSLTKDLFGTELTRLYQNDTKTRNLMNKNAAEIGITPQQYILEVADQYDKSGKLRQSDQLAPVMDARPRKSSGDGSSAGGWVIDNNYDINYGSATPGKTALVTEREGFAIPSSPTITAGKFDLQDSNGNKVKLSDTAQEFKLVRIGTYPVLKKAAKAGGKTIPAGAIATKLYAEKNPNAVEYVQKAVVAQTENLGGFKDTKTYFANPSDVVARVKFTKNQKEAYNAYQQTYNQKQGANSATPTPANPTGKKSLQRGALDNVK